MPDDVPEPEVSLSDEDPPTEAAETAHDDIMKRLLDYQRSLREGASPEEAAEAMKRGIADPSLLEASSAAESLAELLSTEVAPDEIPEPQGETEPEPRSRPRRSPQTEDAVEMAAEEPEIEAAVEAFEPVAREPARDGAGGVRSRQRRSPCSSRPRSRRPARTTWWCATGSRSVLEARVGSLEGKLDDLGAKIAELRRNFQDMAIAADERLAEHGGGGRTGPAGAREGVASFDRGCRSRSAETRRGGGSSVGQSSGLMIMRRAFY